MYFFFVIEISYTLMISNRKSTWIFLALFLLLWQQKVLLIDDKLYANFKREWQKVYDIPFDSSRTQIKFIYSEKAKEGFCKISTVDLSYIVAVKSTVEISQNFVAFSENMNFTTNLLILIGCDHLSTNAFSRQNRS